MDTSHVIQALLSQGGGPVTPFRCSAPHYCLNHFIPDSPFQDLASYAGHPVALDAIANKDLLRPLSKDNVLGCYQDDSRGALRLEDGIAMAFGRFLYYPPVTARRVAESVGQTDHCL